MQRGMQSTQAVGFPLAPLDTPCKWRCCHGGAASPSRPLPHPLPTCRSASSASRCARTLPAAMARTSLARVCRLFSPRLAPPSSGPMRRHSAASRFSSSLVASLPLKRPCMPCSRERARCRKCCCMHRVAHASRHVTATAAAVQNATRNATPRQCAPRGHVNLDVTPRQQARSNRQFAGQNASITV